MQKQTIAMILQFLERANIAGREAPAFMQCIKELNEELSKHIAAQAAPPEAK